jgi:hypothetical protein
MTLSAHSARAAADPAADAGAVTFDDGSLPAGLGAVGAICIVCLCVGTMVGFPVLPAVVATAACGTAAAAWVCYRQGVEYPRRRAAELRAVAAGLGLSCADEVSSDQLAEFRRLTGPPTNSWRHHRADNLLEGVVWGLPVRIVDYYSAAQFGLENYTEDWRTLVLVPAVSGMPDFQLRRLDAYGRLGSWFRGADRLAWAVGNERFSRSYRLEGSREPGVEAMFDERVVCHLAGHPGWNVTARGGTMAIWRDGPTVAEERAHFRLTRSRDPRFRFVSPAAIPALLAGALEIRRLLADAASRRG